MKLERFLGQAGLSDQQFADLLNVDTSTVNRVRSGARTASLALALQIEAASNGQVRAEELPLTPRTQKALAGLRARAVQQEPEAAGESAA